MFRLAIEYALLRGEFEIITSNESEFNEPAQGTENLCQGA